MPNTSGAIHGKKGRLKLDGWSHALKREKENCERSWKKKITLNGEKRERRTREHIQMRGQIKKEICDGRRRRKGHQSWEQMMRGGGKGLSSFLSGQMSVKIIGCKRDKEILVKRILVFCGYIFCIPFFSMVGLAFLHFFCAPKVFPLYQKKRRSFLRIRPSIVCLRAISLARTHARAR